MVSSTRFCIVQTARNGDVLRREQIVDPVGHAPQRAILERVKPFEQRLPRLEAVFTERLERFELLLPQPVERWPTGIRLLEDVILEVVVPLSHR
jgi:hypothetical protein